MTLNIVLDTNVLVAALRSSRGASFRLLSHIDDPSIRLHLSTPIVAEYEAVLKRDDLSLSHSEIDDVIDYLCAIGEHHEIFYLWRPTLKDPDDDFILELAVKSRSHVVTWNLSDFVAAKSFNIGVINPRDFLTKLKGV
jgi:putative PIN family toxin of toxin-antitoxin system